MEAPTFMVGEEVHYHGRRYVIAGRRPGPYGVRLLSASDRHACDAEIVLACESDLSKIDSYLQSRDDTGSR